MQHSSPQKWGTKGWDLVVLAGLSTMLLDTLNQFPRLSGDLLTYLDGSFRRLGRFFALFQAVLNHLLESRGGFGRFELAYCHGR